MRRGFRHPVLLLLAAWCVLVLLAPPGARAGQHTKRLILKDGTYQLATQWEVKGDRVRYYSSERSEWEDVPNSLVDWPATERWEKDHPAGAATAELKELAAEDEAERKEEEAKSPTVAPGLRLPDNGGIFLLDTFQQKQQLVELEQSGGEINKNMGSNILRAVFDPFSGPKQSIELKGAHAKVQAHSLQPTLYVNTEAEMDSDSGSEESGPASKEREKPLPAAERFRILQAQPKKDVRVVGNLKIALTGKVREQGSFVPVTVEPVSGGWYKVAPAAPLKPGEYALVEMLNAKQMNLFVWDFGVDPNAPANPSAWKPAEPGATRTPDTKPVLETRPKN